jgi:hypothetical protein
MDIPRLLNLSGNSANVTSGRCVTAPKISSECTSVRCDLRSPPLWLGSDLALLLHFFAPAARTRSAHPKPLSGSSTRQTPVNGSNYTTAKINRQGFGHACWPLSPACSLNPEVSDRRILIDRAASD